MIFMSVTLRVFLIFFAVLVLLFIVSKLKRSQMQALDCFFWLVFCLCFVLMAIFPDFTEFISRCFGFMSASNFVFLFVIFVLVLRDFSNSLRLAKQEERLNSLVQSIALGQDRTAR